MPALVMTYDVHLTFLIAILVVSCIGYVKSTFPNPCFKVFNIDKEMIKPK